MKMWGEESRGEWRYCGMTLNEGCVGKVDVEVEVDVEVNVEGDAKSHSCLCDVGGSGGHAVLGRLAAGALDSSRYRDFIVM